MQRKLRIASIGALGGLLVTALVAQSPLSLMSDGIQFPDGSVQTTADPRRSFFLTELLTTSIGAPFICTEGYHFASLWEILDVSNLRYATEHPSAYTRLDSGHGPPSNTYGWVRTGAFSSDNGPTGTANCEAWTSLNGIGTIVQLVRVWDDEVPGPSVDWLGPWISTTIACNIGRHVWCMED